MTLVEVIESLLDNLDNVSISNRLKAEVIIEEITSLIPLLDYEDNHS